MGDLIMIYTLCATREQAESIATTLLAEKLIACANIGATITSVYEWKGTPTRAEETPLFLKTLSAHYGKVESRIATLHSYEVPFICALPVGQVYAPYLDWVKDSVA